MKSLLILSGKGGTGKTTTAAAFQKFANAKAIADCDVDAPNLHLVLEKKENPSTTPFYGSDKFFIDSKKCIGCKKCQSVCRFNAIEKSTDGKYSCNEYFCEGCGVCAYVCPTNAITAREDVAGTLYLYKDSPIFSSAMLKMGRGNSGKLVSEVKMQLYKNAENESPLAIIDGSPGIGCPVIASITGVDFVLFVAEPSKSGLSDLKRVCHTAGTLHTPMAVCVNKFDVSLEDTKWVESFCKEKNIPFLGKIPYDKVASKAINAGKSVAEYDSPMRTALLDIFRKVIELMEVNL